MYYQQKAIFGSVYALFFNLIFVPVVLQTPVNAGEWCLTVNDSAAILRVQDSSFFDYNNNNPKIDSWFSEDKGKHLLGSMIGTILIARMNQHILDVKDPGSSYAAAGTVISLGISKELLDESKKNNFFSWKDMLANLTGVLVGLLISGVK